MDRTARSFGAAAAAVALIAVSGTALGAEGAPSRGAARKGGQARPAERSQVQRPGEMTIHGSPDQPGILFFLPRAQPRLLPLRDDRAGKPGLFADDKNTAEIPE